ncbi:MAG: Gfo/Idh/MocA family oxidoreductase [Candidatus Eisenbacteria bacterium]|nr:Gfo/Idh/MocA family oxidoreductase [Candidatus Eisenbacteria bacterium]
MEPVRIGVIGVGAWGRNHARVFQAAPEAEFVGVFDEDAARAREGAERFGCRAFPDAGSLLAEVEAVTVAAPTTAHHSLTLQAIRKGVHVLVEKPIARTVEEAEEMGRAAREAGLVLAVGHLERFNPAVEALLAEERDPRFLEIHRLSPFDVRGLDVSVVLDLMIHDIDILLRLVRSPIASLDAVGVPVLSRAIDIANARIRFENGCVANLTASRISLQKTRKIRIFERDRYISLSYTDQTVTVYRRVGEIPSPDRLTPDSFAKLVRREQPAVEKGEPLRNELTHFLRAVRGEEGARRVTAREGTEALDTALRVLASMDGDRDGAR